MLLFKYRIEYATYLIDPYKLSGKINFTCYKSCQAWSKHQTGGWCHFFHIPLHVLSCRRLRNWVWYFFRRLTCVCHKHVFGACYSVKGALVILLAANILHFYMFKVSIEWCPSNVEAQKSISTSTETERTILTCVRQRESSSKQMTKT